MKAVVYALHSGDYRFRYVGYTTKTADRRRKEHMYAAYESNDPVHRWIRKNKWVVSVVVLEEIDGSIDDIFATERKWIAVLDTYRNGLNCTEGGGGMLGFTHSEKTRRKIGEASAATPRTEVWRSRIAASHAGLKHSEKSREKMRLAWERRRLVPMSEETKRRISEGTKGRVKSIEERQKLSAAHKGKSKSPEHVANLMRSRNKRWKCAECTLESTANNLGYHQSKSGHKGRIEL
ncbi:G-I-Y Y-I-G endonuclease [Gordonia phage GodonK]|uniref:G-I-Y Y-I-G endonuclease n=1 Tax=Gordonia phage GodonK TaxID=2562192 RepID=A0A4D6E490_9CAUD|nr:G-I-Y Y-I-G endonuclease [Gordonia phage GodonK]QBZ72775.1 G-I-Y Y-I-G endonuclease [Gordonia phage GodonK]